MKKIKKIYDSSIWLGEWPFYRSKGLGLQQIKSIAKETKIEKAFICPLDAVYKPEPYLSNLEISNLVKDEDPDIISPIFVLDMSYDNWVDSVNLAIENKNVKILRLILQCHQFSLDEKVIDKILNKTGINRFIISIHTRIEHVVWSYPFLNFNDVNMDFVAKALSAFPEQAFLVQSVRYNQLDYFSNYYNDNLYIDLAFLEMPNTLKTVTKKFPAEKIVFSSHIPLFCLEANIAKLQYADIPDEDIDKISYKNMEDLLGLLEHNK
jgi:predicted TIM-barrel fold metal-dependent hydrolase